jgi:RHS repeat-associated protein
MSGGVRYVWDAENRLRAVIPAIPVAGQDRKVEYGYDYLGRRVIRRTYDWDGQALAWTGPVEVTKYVYDGWRVIMELDGLAGDIPTRKFSWGLDLAAQAGQVNSLESAGGIGGLLAAEDTAGTVTAGDDRTFIYFADANGNIGQVVETTAGASYGTVAAHYEYAPFGKRINTASPTEYDQPYRFSSKPFDSETDLGYWGYRHYSPELGRWISWDPLGEDGGFNLYSFVDNAPSQRLDSVGLWGADVHYGLVRDLAEWAGISCPNQVAKWANFPDVDPTTSPESNATMALVQIVMYGSDPNQARDAARRLRRIAEWHFPSDPDGVVRPGSDAARVKMNAGRKNCNLEDFGKGIHVFQDSWSHQGRPYVMGVGHARGAVLKGHWEMQWFPQKRFVYVLDGGYELIRGRRAALARSADDTNIWAADARAMAMEVYAALTDFKDGCPCACRGGESTSTRPALSMSDVEDRLRQRYQGGNKVNWDLEAESAR